MKKNIILMAVAAAVLSACSTMESPYETGIVPEYTAEGNTVLYATMPQFVSGTKAGVTDAGVFSWTSGDVIDVVYTKDAVETTYTFHCTDTATGAFESDDEIAAGSAVTRAYYPHDYNGTPSDQHFSSLDEAAKGFQMSATVSGGKLSFTHDNAMFVITVSNVPKFAKTVWINNASVDISSLTGNVVVRMPVIPAVAANLNIGVTDADWDADSHNDLISKTSEKSAAIVAKNLYKLADLDLAPEVHFLSTRSGWTVTDANIISGSGSVYTANNSIVEPELDSKWFRFAVKYPNYTVNYGYASGQEYDNDSPFEPYCENGASIEMPGIYNISFNAITGDYTVSATDTPLLYLIGINGSWTFDSSTNPLTRVFGKMYAWKGTPTNAEYKVYLYGDTDWSGYYYGAETASNKSGSIFTKSSSQNAGVDTDEAVVIVYDFGLSSWYYSSDKVSDAPTKVQMRGDFNGDSWSSGVELTQHATYPNIWYKENFVVTSAGDIKFVENEADWYGAGSDPKIELSTNPNYRLWKDSADNMTIAVGTYTIYYNAFAHSYSLEVL